ncbi:hypothetical protein CHELA20_53145 [Hyphomicrobiales bacterium]|nr:hypothetical protein CHELA41_21780 [Hyphomicrobiales bacterium]CAH1683664.1 hypothetical protein CHELA20_53145 [Hyphomicrobiales bacterium]
MALIRHAAVLPRRCKRCFQSRFGPRTRTAGPAWPRPFHDDQDHMPPEVSLSICACRDRPCRNRPREGRRHKISSMGSLALDLLHPDLLHHLIGAFNPKIRLAAITCVCRGLCWRTIWSLSSRWAVILSEKEGHG